MHYIFAARYISCKKTSAIRKSTNWINNPWLMRGVTSVSPRPPVWKFSKPFLSLMNVNQRGRCFAIYYLGKVNLIDDKDCLNYHFHRFRASTSSTKPTFSAFGQAIWIHSCDDMSSPGLGISTHCGYIWG